jgi:hypothetical protein
VLRLLLHHYRDERRPGEGFGDYCQRLGQQHAQTLLLPLTGGFL